ncbi:MAG TPA: rhodanese-like domain-containing protein [Thermoleophilaceae bacterium]|nr:rhodanese-like domain-containing protein [Thermoleophilaceae bacterium]
MPETISREELKGLIDRRAVTVVEALPGQYFEQEHLPGAVNVPHDAERERIEELLTDKSAPVVTYCASLTCRNSAQLAARLARMGYTDVREYAEGKVDWVDAGLPTETGTALTHAG